MPLWGTENEANSSVKWAGAQLMAGSGAANQASKNLALYGNTTADAYVTGETISQIFVSTADIKSGSVPVSVPGWYMKRIEGAGGRSGRTTYELLVAFSTSGASDPFYNINATTTANFKAAFIANSANIPISFMGDSTMRGTDELALPYNTQFQKATPFQLASLLNAAGINAGNGNIFGSGTTTIADLALRDGRFTSSGTAVFGSVQTQGGSDWNLPSATAALNFTPQIPVTKFDIYWRDAAAGRNFSWAIDGGSTTTISSSGVAQMVKTTVSAGALGTHTLNLVQVLGSVNIFGINGYNDTRKEIHCMNWGVNGATTATMVGNVGPPNGGRLQFLSVFPPKLVIAECGIVNDWRNSVSVATSKANMLTLINAVKAAGSDFWFLVPPYDGGSTGLTANQNAYVQAMYELAASEGVGLIDLRRSWLSYANQLALGLVGDNVHPTVSAGYPSTAAVVYAALRKII